MSLVGLLFALLVIGAILTGVNKYSDAPAFIKYCVNAIAFLVILFFVLQFFGLIGPIPRLR